MKIVKDSLVLIIILISDSACCIYAYLKPKYEGEIACKHKETTVYFDDFEYHICSKQ
jgi:hypothetical protein